ncbi:MAG: FAD-dependent thymidylate synthase [Geminicoccaceae bacterium]
MPLTHQQRADIDEARAQSQPSRRARVEAMEDILYQAMPVLDRGFIRVIDYMGDDAAIVQAARVSYGKGTKQVSDDRGLINYLMRHWHTSPFEMNEIKLHVKLPIFVARQWIRHRTANVNEISARYSILENEFYLPDIEHLAPQSESNRQGRAGTLDESECDQAFSRLRGIPERAFEAYFELLNVDDDGTVMNPTRQGIARELARSVLPLSTYTQWYWKTDLHNLMHFIMLRADFHAQYEIRAYAEALLEIVRRWVPLTATAFEDYRLNSAHISGKGLAVIRRLLAGEQVEQPDSHMSKREFRELMTLLGRDQGDAPS